MGEVPRFSLGDWLRHRATHEPSRQLHGVSALRVGVDYRKERLIAPSKRGSAGPSLGMGHKGESTPASGTQMGALVISAVPSDSEFTRSLSGKAR